MMQGGRDFYGMHLTIEGNPITKKNSLRIIKLGNYHKILPSKQYVKYEQEALKQLIDKPVEPISCTVNVRCEYFMQTKRRVDLVNLLEGTLDILVHADILEDDNSKIVVSHDGCAVKYDKNNPRVEIYIERREDMKGCKPKPKSKKPKK